MTATIFNTTSPEVAWEPFTTWLTEQGLEADDVTSIVIHDDGSAVAVVLVRDDTGAPQLVDGEPVTRFHRIDQITAPPPRRHAEGSSTT